MSDRRADLLLQVCANDQPPFADVCRYHAAAARALGWRVETLMLASRRERPAPEFHYLHGSLAAALPALVGDGEPRFVLCHRYRAYRAVVDARVPWPVVAVAHEFGFLRRRRRRWQQRLDRLRGRGPVTFAGVSDAVRDELGRAAGEALLLPNGLDLERADADRLPRADARLRLGLDAGAFCIGVVGRLHPKKNPLLAVAGFGRAAARLGEAQLVLVGDGELAEPAREAAAGLPVQFAGFVPGAATLMAAFDLLLVPSGRHEAFGMVALEAMAARVPVLTGPSAGLRFVIGDTGRQLAEEDPDELAEALVALHQEWRAGRLAARAERARARVEREFSVPAGAGRLQALALGQ